MEPMNTSPSIEPGTGACTPRRVHTNGVFFRILDAAAAQLARHMAIPDENREAFRQQLRIVIEQQIVETIGADYLRITGWAVLPSARQARRERIADAIRAGETDAAIATRELVSQRHVRNLRAAVGTGST